MSASSSRTRLGSASSEVFHQKQLEQFRCFDADGNRQIFRVVELPPVPFITEPQKYFGQFTDIRITQGPKSPRMTMLLLDLRHSISTEVPGFKSLTTGCQATASQLD